MPGRTTTKAHSNASPARPAVSLISSREKMVLRNTMKEKGKERKRSEKDKKMRLSHTHGTSDLPFPPLNSRDENEKCKR
jgi:hypothetical protein